MARGVVPLAQRWQDRFKILAAILKTRQAPEADGFFMGK